ncbi:MAG: hypothetical protein OXU61_13280 [Gammaproteobacteria bacterium]|nr:hypothetical protein [Gammaproteobacteria bacterium]
MRAPVPGRYRAAAVNERTVVVLGRKNPVGRRQSCMCGGILPAA